MTFSDRFYGSFKMESSLSLTTNAVPLGYGWLKHPTTDEEEDEATQTRSRKGGEAVDHNVVSLCGSPSPLWSRVFKQKWLRNWELNEC